MTTPGEEHLAAALRVAGWFCAAPGEHGWTPVAGQTWEGGCDTLRIRVVAGGRVWTETVNEAGNGTGKMVTLERFGQWVRDNKARPAT